MSQGRMDEKREGVRIEDIAHAGDGVGRLPDGRAIFVPRTLPGEVVDVRVVEERANFLRGRVETWRERAAERRKSDCPYFEACGGCQFWHADYDRELEWKSEAARDVVERNFGADVPEPRVEAAPVDRRYRTRVRFHRRATEEGADWSVGLFGRGTRDLVEIEDCLVAADPINEARSAVEPALRDVGNAELRVETAGGGEAVVSIFPGEEAPETPPDSLVTFAEKLDEQPPIRGIRFVGDDRISVGGDATVDGDQVLAEVPVESIRLPAGLFRQANPDVNDRLVERVCSHLEERGARRVLELFCGVGNFTFPVGRRIGPALGIEIDEVAVEMGETMCEFARRDELTFVQADLADGFADLDAVDDFPFETVLMDPPRGGAAEVCEDLAATSAELALYVSCDPPALGRDLEILAEGGWRPTSIEMFDMFPRTSHMEVLAVLERRS